MKTLILTFAFVLSSCVTASTVPGRIANEIPNGATAVVIYSASDCYAALYRHLAGAGYAFEQENAEMGTLKTAPRAIGQGTTIIVNAYSEDADGGCRTTLRGVWGITQEMAVGLGVAAGASVAGGTSDEAKWSIGRPRRAFGELAMIAEAVDHVRIEYLK